MSQRRIYTAAAPIAFDAIRAELGIPAEFRPEVLAEASRIATVGPWIAPDRADRTALPLVTLDPPGSMDLDQAVLIESIPAGGYQVYYAIADVASLVRPTGDLAAESFARGTTLYSPDSSTPLHPRVMSEGVGSLLPDQRRPAVLWSIALDGMGEPQTVGLERVWVQSVARLDYPTVARDVAAGAAHPSLRLLPEVGRLRQALARQRHAITLNLPDVEVVRRGDDGWALELASVLDIEQYNAEISLLTGMCAAQIMLAGGVGILRTLPDPAPGQVDALRRTAKGLGIAWPDGAAPGDVIASLDPGEPQQAAFLDQAARLLRGAAYTPFDTREPDDGRPELAEHAGIGAPYAHVTAPLRRLVDRFGTEICLALHTGTEIPDWVRDRLVELPAVMATADRRAHELERACIGAVGAFLLSGREGDTFDATVVQVNRETGRATVALAEPPVRAQCACDGLGIGDRVSVVLQVSDPGTHTYTVALAGQPADG